VGVNVSNDAAAFRAAITEFKDRDIKRAVAIALNRTADRVRAEAVRRIRQTYRIQQRELNRGFTIRRAWAGNLQSLVYASGRPLNVIGFEARQTKNGVSVNIKGTRKVIRHAFIARLPNYTGVFMRKGKSRFPIKAIRTVDVPGLFESQIVKHALASVAVDAFRLELGRSVRAILARS
jgi:hypothetical protein